MSFSRMGDVETSESGEAKFNGGSKESYKIPV